MKGFSLAFIALAVLIVATTAAPASDDVAAVAAPKKECNNFCTYEFAPVCGYDGACYKQYPNKCGYDYAKCSAKSSLETVDMSLCELATKNNHPNYKTCSE